jgi:hypothetical protein
LIRLLATFAIVIAAATALVACGGGSSDDPQTIVDEATLQGIESGKLDLEGELDLRGTQNGHIAFSLSGPFQKQDEEELPELDLSASVKGSVAGEGIDFRGGLTLLPSKAFVEYSGVEYEVDPTTFAFVKSTIQKRAGKQGESGEASACQEAVAEIKVSNFIENLRDEGTADVGGTSTTKIVGDLDTSGGLDALVELSENPACSEELSAAGSLPPSAELNRAKERVARSVKGAHVELYVGDDHIVRKLVIQVPTIEPPAGGNANGVKRLGLELDLTLTGVNEGQTITVPQQAKPLSDLFLKLGVNPLELAGVLSEEGGLEGLLEGLGGSLGGGSGGGSSGGGSAGGGGSSGGQQAYLNCIREAHTAVDIQKCAGLLQ